MKHIYAVICLIAILVGSSEGKEAPWKQKRNMVSAEERSAVLKEVRTNLKSISTLEEWPGGKQALNDLILNHPFHDLGWFVCGELRKYAQSSRCTKEKKIEIVEFLTDKMARGSSSLRQALKPWLLTFKKPDFNEDAKEIIAQHLGSFPSRKTILLAGLAEVESVYPKINSYASEELKEPGVGMYYGTKVWASLLVTARHGNKDSIRRLLEAVDKENNIVTRGTLLFKHLEYVRQPEIVRGIGRYLTSTERLPPLVEGRKGIRLAYYASRSLARVVKDYPVKLSFSAQKEWLDKQEKIEFKEDTTASFAR